MVTMRTAQARCPAKINLSLAVLGRRPDGYHEIDSLVARISLCDAMSFALRGDERIVVHCDDAAAPSDASNLAARAAEALRAGRPLPGVEIALHKRIPVAAGLGGGSSNAATALRVLRELWRLDVSDAELARIGATIGSDVPVFLQPAAACRISGRGEVVEPLRLAFAGVVVLILPAIHSSTAAVYAAWSRRDTPGSPAPAPAGQLSAAELMALARNDLEPAACEVQPRLGELAGALRRRGPVCMSGSGSAFFRLFDDRRAAERFAHEIRDELETRTELVRFE
ncbi:MAG: 4-diphosphocytidyl-2-C-methyl-D-erythritol kinase [Phycisphaerae bacterium]|nr:4-diphosphocytidyl-2-C-methyl-D-erythritol kinase [Phycisphaerae bacterium]